MLKRVRGKSAQVMSSEYVLIFFLILGMITAMSIYFRRTVQGRVFSATNFMLGNIRNELAKELTEDEFAGNLYAQYEPYYLDTESSVTRRADDRSELKESFGLSSGIFHKDIYQTTAVKTNSITAPPRSADGLGMPN